MPIARRRLAPPLRRLRAGALLAALTLAAGTIAAVQARAQLEHPPIPTTSELPACDGDPITPTRVVTGQFPASLTGSYVMVPFEVPAGTTQVRVKYCWERNGSTVDLGLWEARDGDAPWGPDQFRGWGGSSHPDVSITPQGCSSEADYLAKPRGHVPGRTTRGFLPGPIPPGTWAVELGVAFVADDTGDGGDGLTDFRVEIELSDDPAFNDEPYVPAPYDESPAIAAPGWYIGDLHVHAEHSNLGAATMTETFEYAFTPRDQGGAGLDFIALTDYVTPSAWGEIGRYQAQYPDKVIIRSSETITYKGHANQHRSLRYLDHRIGGPVWELDPATGALTVLRESRTPAELFAEIEAAGGIAQINHPRSCPPETFSFCLQLCRGCSWQYTPEESDYARVNAMEVPSGSSTTFVLFGGLAIDFWEERLAEGRRVAVVGVSDSHEAGADDPADPFDSPIGNGATVVYAEELSEAAIVEAIRAGHTYAKLEAAGADLRFWVEGDQGGSGIMGDAIPDTSATLYAQVLNVPDGAPEHTLLLYRDGVLEDAQAVEASGLERSWDVGPGLYRIDVIAGGLVRALSSAIQVPEPAPGAAALAAVAALAALRRRR
jgi:MYXO-CTERM domain-containing protein